MEPPSQFQIRTLRAASGHVTDRRRLVSFLYKLMRDHLPCGTVEALVCGVEREAPAGVIPRCPDEDDERIFTNGFLSRYAQNLADRLEYYHNDSLPGELCDDQVAAVTDNQPVEIWRAPEVLKALAATCLKECGPEDLIVQD